MATAKHSTRKVKAPRRFTAIDLGHGKSITPIRTEFGVMEYEAAFGGDIICIQATQDEAETYLNEWFFDAMQHGLIPDDMREIAPAVTEVPINVLADGSTVYGNLDGGHPFVATVTDANGFHITTSDESTFGIGHAAMGFELDGITLAQFEALKVFVNSGAVEHMLRCGLAWTQHQAAPSVRN